MSRWGFSRYDVYEIVFDDPVQICEKKVQSETVNVQAMEISGNTKFPENYNPILLQTTDCSATDVSACTKTTTQPTSILYFLANFKLITLATNCRRWTGLDQHWSKRR